MMVNKQLVTVAALAAMFCFQRPAAGILNCHDYSYFAVTKTDCNPPGCGRSNGLSADMLRQRLRSLGYTLIGSPKSHNDLQPGDVILLGISHSGVVNSSGFIDHWLQLANRSGTTARTTGIPKDPNRLPGGGTEGYGQNGGFFKNDSLTLFLGRPVGSTKFFPKDAFIWRKTGIPMPKQEIWLGDWVPVTNTKPPTPTMRFEKAGGQVHAYMNFGKNTEVQLVKLDAKNFEGILDDGSGFVYKFKATLDPDTVSCSGEWSCGNASNAITQPLKWGLRY